jgi:hypothetical protein
LLRIADIHNNRLHMPVLFLKNLVPVFCHCTFQAGGERRCGGKDVVPLLDQPGGNGKPHRRGRKPQRRVACPRPAQDDIAALLRHLGRARGDATQQPQEMRVRGGNRGAFFLTHPGRLSSR